MVNEVLKLRAEACLESLPAQLAKEYKKFQYSKVNAHGNSPQKADGLQCLVDVGFVMRTYNLREISSPLEGAKIPREFKVFFVDTGLLASQLEGEKGFVTLPLYALGFLPAPEEQLIVPEVSIELSSEGL